jgi:hypothetical protein
MSNGCHVFICVTTATGLSRNCAGLGRDWRAGSLKAGPLWLVDGRRFAYVPGAAFKAPASDPAVPAASGGRDDRRGLGSFAQGRHGLHAERLLGDTGPNGPVTDFYLGSLSTLAARLQYRVQASASSRPIRLIFASPRQRGTGSSSRKCEATVSGLLRHAFITAALDAGVPLGNVQEAASHADPRTTMRYGRSGQSVAGPARHLHRRASIARGSAPGPPGPPWRTLTARRASPPDPCAAPQNLTNSTRLDSNAKTSATQAPRTPAAHLLQRPARMPTAEATGPRHR